MKKFLILIQIVLVVSFACAQTNVKKSLPSVQIKTLDGKTVNTSSLNNNGNSSSTDKTRGETTSASGLSNNGKPMIISFWATWCKPCIKELSTIAEVYEEWQKETGVKLIAISIDDSRSVSKVQTLVDGKAWEFEVYSDINGDFKRAMNVNEIPSVFVIDGNGNIVWQHTSFSEGGELQLIEIVKKVIAGEDVSNSH